MELTKKKDSYTGYERAKYLDYLIASLYTLIPPVRLDYATMFVIDNPQDNNGIDNYLWITNSKRKHFIFNSFKNSASIGSEIFLIPMNLNKIINIWLDMTKTDKFIVDRDLKPVSTNLFGKYIKRIFTNDGKKPSLNIIRHAWASAQVDLRKKKEQEDLAKKMIHTASMNILYAKE